MFWSLRTLTAVLGGTASHLHKVLAFALLWLALRFAVAPTLSRWLVGEPYRSLSRVRRVLWDLRVITALHSAAVVPLAAVVVFDRAFSHEPIARLHHSSPYAQWLFANSAGYFLFAFVAGLTKCRQFSLNFFFRVLASMVACLVCLRPFAPFYGAALLALEVTTPLTSFHWFLEEIGLGASVLQRSVDAATLAVYAAVRIFVAWYATLTYIDDVDSAARMDARLVASPVIAYYFRTLLLVLNLVHTYNALVLAFRLGRSFASTRRASTAATSAPAAAAAAAAVAAAAAAARTKAAAGAPASSSSPSLSPSPSPSPSPSDTRNPSPPSVEETGAREEEEDADAAAAADAPGGAWLLHPPRQRKRPPRA
jgi:hypothetical protein